MGFTVPPYPSSLKVTGLGCEMVALLEFQDGNCPWYYVLIPNSAWPTTGTSTARSFSATRTKARACTPTESSCPRAPPRNTGLPTPARPTTRMHRPPSAWTGRCKPIPTSSTPRTPAGLQECGGSGRPGTDPCSPPQPAGYHTVHFRYLWAGQKTFTFFPKPELMPKWIELEVNSPDKP